MRRRAWKRTVFATGVLALGSVLISGCSTIRYAYDNAHYLLVELADDRLELTSAQEERLETRLRDYMSWHRSELLPEYVEYLRHAENQLAEPLESTTVIGLMDEGRKLVRRTMKSVATVSAKTLAETGEEQHASLAESFAESNTEYREEHLGVSAEERLESRQERVAEQFESWLGDLTEKQRAMIRQHVRDWPDTSNAWLAYRKKRQEGLLELLRSEASADRIESYLRDWWFRRKMPEELRRDRKRISGDVNDLIVKIQDSMMPRQRQHLVDRIGDIREQLGAALSPQEEDAV